MKGWRVGDRVFLKMSLENHECYFQGIIVEMQKGHVAVVIALGTEKPTWAKGRDVGSFNADHRAQQERKCTTSSIRRCFMNDGKLEITQECLSRSEQMCDAVSMQNRKIQLPRLAD